MPLAALQDAGDAVDVANGTARESVSLGRGHAFGSLDSTKNISTGLVSWQVFIVCAPLSSVGHWS